MFYTWWGWGCAATYDRGVQRHGANGAAAYHALDQQLAHRRHQRAKQLITLTHACLTHRPLHTMSCAARICGVWAARERGAWRTCEWRAACEYGACVSGRGDAM